MTVRTGTKYDVVITVGTDLIVDHTLSDELGLPVDLTGAKMTAGLRAEADDAAAGAFEIEVISLTEGKLRLHLTREVTGGLAAGRSYAYDLYLLLPDDHPVYPGCAFAPVYGTIGVLGLIAPAPD